MEKQRTVRVSNLGNNVNETALLIYFQKKKVGGGGVQEVRMFPGNEAALVVFGDGVRDELLEKEHVIKEQLVKVRLVKDSENGSNSSQERFSNSDEKTILVRDLPDNVTVNQIKIHFQRKRNAGGSIQDAVLLEGGKNGATVTFDDPEVARAVLKQKQVISGKTVTTTILGNKDKDQLDETPRRALASPRPNESEHPPTTEKQPIRKDDDEEGRGHHPGREGKSTTRRTQPTQDKQQGHHQYPPGFDRQTQSSGLKSWGRHETVNDDEGNENSKTGNEDEPRGLEQNPPTELQRTVLVSDIPAEVTELEVLLYFQKKVNGGGEVADAKLSPEEQKALVVFQEVEVADTVIRKEHFLKGKPVGVEKYKPTPEKIEVDCIFTTVTAVVNYVLLQNVTREACKNLLDETQEVCGIQWHHAAHGMLVTGTLEQVKRAKEFLQDKFDVNCVEQQGRESDSLGTNKWKAEYVFGGLLTGQMAEGVRREFTEDTVNISKQNWPQHCRMQQTYQRESKEEAWPSQQGKDTEFGDHNSGATTKKMRDKSEPNTPLVERSQPYSPRGQEQSKKHTLCTPSSFIENNALPQQRKNDGGKSLDEKSNQDSGSDFSHSQPSMNNQTGHQATKPTPAPRSNREPSYQATQPTGHGNGGQGAGTPERRRIGASFNAERGPGKQNQSERNTEHSPTPRRTNNLMDFGTDTQTSSFRKQSVEEDKREQLEDGNKSVKHDPEKTHADDTGLVTDQEQVKLEGSVPNEDKAQEREDGAKPSDQGVPDNSMDIVLNTLQQLNLDEDLSSINVVQFIQTVYSQDLEGFKSQNCVDIVLSKDKGLQLKPMREFEDSEFEEVKNKFQRFYEVIAKDLKREILDLSELSGQDVEKIKKSIMKQRERSDVMVEETSTDVFTLVGEAGNVELFRKNAMGALGSKGPAAESKPLEDDAPLVVTRKGVRVVLMMGAIEKQECEAIVNFTDNELVHKSGIPYAIREAAGEHFWTECRSIIAKNGPLVVNMVTITTAGSLPSSFVIHAILPDPSKERRQDVLRYNLEETCRLICSKAIENNLQTICFPVVTPDIANFPTAVSSRVLFSALKKFIEAHNFLEDNTLKEIRIVYQKSSKSAEDYKKEFKLQF